MNNTASLKRTDNGWLSTAFPASRVATILAAVLLTVILISFRPFQPAGAEGAVAGEGDIVNQLGFGSLGGLAIFGLLTFANPRTITAFISPWWILMLGFMMLSVFNAADPSSAFRAASFTLIGIVAVIAILAVPRDADSFSAVLTAAGMFVLVASYVGLIVFPTEAIHTTASNEPEHAGLWRGVFAHKNVAGPVMACFSFAGIYLVRRGWRKIGVVLFLAAMLFMINTGSKTTAGLVPMSILIVVLPGIAGMRILTVAFFAAAIAGTGLATLGMVFIDPIKELAHQLAPDMTYTGRTTLWEFSGEMIAKRPWTGYGFESFWGSPLLLNTDQPFDRAWDIRSIVHGHNGYLDIAVIMGLPALCVAVFTFLVEPLRDYMRIPHSKENIYLGDLFMMIVLFTALNAFLESFFFRRADPVWLFFVMGVLGLRMVARIPVRSGH